MNQNYSEFNNNNKCINSYYNNNIKMELNRKSKHCNLYDDMNVKPILNNIILHNKNNLISFNYQYKNKWTRRRINKLWDAVVFGVCLFCVVRLPSPVMSAPVNERHSRGSSPADSGPTGNAKWIKPCGMGGVDTDDSSLGGEFDSEMVFAENEELSNIVLLARTAQNQANRFREEYVKSTFNVDFTSHHESWKDLHYDWLPELPKNLGESTPVDHLQGLELPQSLKDSYMFLQKFAVGLEQVVWDQEEGSGFKPDFQATEYSLRSVLCEIQTAMLERNVKQHADVTRNIMSREFRDMNKGNSSVRNLRDWFIFRDYMNGLEYVVDVFEYFINKSGS